VQSVQFAAGESRETVLPAAPAAAFHRDESTWARVLLPVPARHIRDGVLRVAFVNEGGPDAVVSEIWLLEKTRDDERKRVLIVTGDDYPGHLWRETAPEFAAILREDPRLEVSICEAPAVYGSPLLDHYDATFLHFKNYAARLPLGQAVWDGLARHVASGRGLVVAHFGCGAFQEWDGFVDIAGRIWDPALRAHDPYGPFTVRVADPGHPVTDGMNDFETRDELYTCLAGETPIRVLCEATSVVDGKDYPMAFQVEETGGRVIHCILGHDVAALSAPGTRAFYRRACAWAAGL
jgi:type 1 glutamine amidotransferase